MRESIEKQGEYGTLRLYAVAYRDECDADNAGEVSLWAYSSEHATERFYDSADAEGWRVLKVARRRADGLRHRMNWHAA